MNFFIRDKKVIIVYIGAISVALHVIGFIFLYNNRTILAKNLYCNVYFPGDILEERSPNFKVTLGEPSKDGDKKDGTSEEQNQQEKQEDSDNPAGKFQSSFHAEKGENKELIQRLHQSLDLRQENPIIRSPDGKLYSKNGKPLSNKSLKQQGQYPLIYDDMLPGNQVKKSYIFRKRQYQDIVVKEVLPTLYTIDKAFQDIIKLAPKDLEKYNKRNEIIHDFKIWSNGENPDSYMKLSLDYKKTNDNGREPLHFSSLERKKYFDNTLTQSKDLQLSNFIKRYFHHDPNTGDLPLAIRELYYENLQRLAYDFSGDKTYFMVDYFQENLNKEDFLKHALEQISRLKGTKAATELLFTVDNIYEIQQRAIRLLLDFITTYPQLSNEQKRRLGTETLNRVAKRYKSLLAQKKIFEYSNAVELYSKKRLEIMDFLLASTPNRYRSNDALFEKGVIYWNLARQTGRRDLYHQAFSMWKQIRSVNMNDSNFINKETYSQIAPFAQQYNGNIANLGISEEMMIHRSIDMRFMKDMDKKRKREDTLLWR